MRNTIRIERSFVDITQEELAGMVGVSRQSINLIENNQVIPSVKVALRMAQVFDKDVRDFFFLEDKDC